MADGTITLEIVTPKGLALREEVDELTARSTEGELGILPQHIPLLAALRTGLVGWRKGAEERRVAVGDGFLEVEDDRAVVLVDRYATRDDVDPVRVRLELKEIDEKLARWDGQPGTPDWQALVADENWAAVRLELCGDPPAATIRPFDAPESPEPEVPDRDGP